MYEFITGKIAELSPTYAVIETAGVGYMLNITLNTYAEIEKKDSAKLYTHFVVREDAQILYGFATRSERELFQHLLCVSGVGGNTARMALSTYSTAELRQIILTENVTMLKAIKGLGLKTAQKIILELSGKMLKLTGEEIGDIVVMNDNKSQDEAVEALVMLGFNKSACQKTIAEIIKSSPNSGVEELIRLALKRL